MCRTARIRPSLVACLGLVLAGLAGGNAAVAQQSGNAFLVFDITTGRLSMNPGDGGTAQVNSFGFKPASPLVFNGSAVFPSGTAGPFAVNTSVEIGNGFFSATAPDVVPTSSFLSRSNLQLSSSSGNVIASTIPGSVGTPEFSFGNVGPTNLTQEQALTAFGATEQGGFGSSTRAYYGLVGGGGVQTFRVYAVPEPGTVAMLATGAAVGAVVLGRRRSRARPVA